MRCAKCHEIIEGVEDYTTDYSQGAPQYFHWLCTPPKVREDSAKEDDEFNRIADEARKVC